MSVGCRLGRVFWVSVLCAACGARGAPPPAAAPSAAKLEARPPAPASGASPTLHLTLRGSAIEIDQESVPSSTLPLRGALARHRGAATTLEVAALDAEDDALARVLEAASGTELEQVVLVAGAARYELWLVPRGAPTHELTVDPDTSKLRLSATAADTGSWGTLEWPIDAPPAELSKPVCSKACVIVLPRGAPRTGQPPLLDMLASLRRMLREEPAEIVVQSWHAPSARVGGHTVSGRLPPEVIQRIVRQNFSELRKCYEQGLARDANLQATVRVRFVIDREGHVPKAIDDGSDLPDAAVRDCVFSAFKLFVFPKPEGGIVTVVYPIMLVP